ncbi:extracellular solute-binding protein [Paenibacillus tarimensis]
MKKTVLLLLTLFLAVSLLAACGKSGNGGNDTPAANTGNKDMAEGTQAKLDPVTLKIMIPGDRPRDFDAVIAEAEKRMADTLNVKLDVVFIPWADLGQKTQVTLSSGENIDLIFDAPWLHLNQMVAGGYYEPLDELLEKYGQNIVTTRSEQMMEANKYNGKIMAVPLSNAFLSGRVYYVRKDIREKLGVPEIKSYDELIKLAYTIKEKMPEITPIISHNNGPMSWAQYRKVFDYENSIKDTQIGTDGVLYHKNNDGKVYNMFDEKDPVYWGWITDARKLYQDKLMYQDVLSLKDANELYKSGKAAILNTNDFGVNADLQSAVKQGGGEVEAVTFFSTEKGANITDFKAWNFLALASVSKNKERAIMFLDWANQKENYDLLAYGIQGQNWEPAGEDRYKKLNDGYGFFPYAWIWNPTHDRLSADLDEETVQLTKFTTVADNFTADILTGFTFDTAPVANEIAQFNSIRDKYIPAISNGVVDSDSTWEKYKAEGYDVSKKIQAEMQKQIDAFLASK